MAKFCFALLSVLLASACAFAPVSQQQVKMSATALNSAKGYWDPLGLYTLGSGDAFDTFPSMFPKEEFLDASEAKHGRMAMLAWTGVWATTEGGFGLGLHFPGFPEVSDWTQGFGVFAAEQPAWFGSILALVCIAEGESVGHSGDNWRGKSTKTEPSNLNFDYLGIKQKISPDKYAHYKDVETKNGRAAMVAMASLFAFKAIPGSVPIMDLLGAQ